ncbi:PPOX class probable F420-dependent enzyme, Rv0121 family [Candidatus Nitrososphaera evergladensis SR1]|uniref:PPOX class probable F420-dependent enzyme, Rv0121 family n=1 Tax=Candidatus Nitrososphaera evergladensis SR1 TaxID=1459636 RepID=A0A075MU02_9ARCH|nr:TIGR03668 family PPOX class F420-dependent oxidoreductase [Candidatus Nitrososphaera evergladensis]AIF84670.1 PPOX class probable F420-dependent enzyme, Rv0121 family [Candidatus Nitrososphaera evergladensis SR1]
MDDDNATAIIAHDVKELVERARVARLATVDSESKPHLVPIVFVFDDNCFFVPIDEKRKTVKPENLRRLRNIRDNPNVALLIDEYYDDDWTRLAFVMIRGKASIMMAGKTQGGIQLNKVYEKLIAKYPQYQKIGPGETCIVIRPEKVTSWRNS